MPSFRHVATATLALALALALAHHALALQITINDTESIKSAASTIAYGLVKYYHGNESGMIPGELGDPYYWWECGAMFNSLINYWYYTGDTTYNQIVKQGMIFQVGPDNDYMPPNQTKSEGNDDQVFWAFAAMSAAELGFENPDSSDPQWLALAQAVFNTQVARWDSATCGGGLRWQIFTWNNGYNYKNAPSNGGLFNLATRLGAYTKNESYFDYAEKVWNWMETGVGLIGSNHEVYDGTSVGDNCTSLDHTRWTYTQGMMLHGAAVMWNHTESDTWRNRTQGLWNSTGTFWADGKIMRELCEPSKNCNTDQQSFKAYLARFAAAAVKVAPWLYDTVMPYIYASATAAAQQCSGGTDGTTCGLKWTENTTWDGSSGVGEQMSALEVIQATMIKEVSGPVSEGNGGTSQGDPTAGTKSDDDGDGRQTTSIITKTDRAGAWIVTAIFLLGTMGGSYWLVA